MAKTGTILVVDDNRNILIAAEALLKRYFERVITIPNPSRIMELLRSEKPDVVLLDMNFNDRLNSGNEGLYWLKEIKSYRPDTQVVVFTAYGDIKLAVTAIKEGAADFVVKPWENDKLVASLLAAYNLRKSKGEVRRLEQVRKQVVGTGQNRREGEFFWGKSAAMKELRAMVEKVARTDANILITGENGTGKEMLAREIHRLSPRRKEVMVAVDMGAVPPSLFESELFGHTKGAFTGATEDRAGKFEVADQGTLFLDEIGNLPPELQAKLLNVLQSRSVTRVGSNVPIPVDIRLISATNRNLADAIVMGEFREDLLYRINTIHLELPPLRERADDIVGLAEMFMKRYGEKYGKRELQLTRNAAKKLRNAYWPGNIRELQHTIEKAVIISEEPWIDENALSASRPPVAPPAPVATLEEMEREMIRVAMETHSGHLGAVAEALGITRQTLYNKMKKYGDVEQK